MPPDLIVIPCSAVKAAVPAASTALPARELYQPGSYHLACRRAAEALAADVSEIRVLSARYGLVRLDDRIATYELRIGQPGAVDADVVRQQASAQGLLGARTVWALAGQAYTRIVTDVWPAALLPLLGTRGIGEQRSRLSQIRRAADPWSVALAFAPAASLDGTGRRGRSGGGVGCDDPPHHGERPAHEVELPAAPMTCAAARRHAGRAT